MRIFIGGEERAAEREKSEKKKKKKREERGCEAQEETGRDQLALDIRCWQITAEP